MAVRLLIKYISLPRGYSIHLQRDIMFNDRRDRMARRALDVSYVLAVVLSDVLRLALAAIMIVGLLQAFGITAAKAADIAIPRAALPHKAALVRAAHAELGLSAPVALLAAQIHTVSLWRENAVSPVGARGLAQFMPATARWLPTVAPHTGEPSPFNPGWSLRALCAYDAYLLRQIRMTAGPRDRWAFTLSAYNGGLGWVRRDRALAASTGRDPARYWGSVEHVNAGRKPSAFRENRDYPRRIFAAQDVYEQAGWGPAVP